MTHNVTFNGIDYPDGKIVNLACGHISLNQIEFINEGILVNIDAISGEVVFCDSENNELSSTKVATPLSGDEKFSEVKCMVEGDQIKLGFPEYSYKDNYPHCDGEHDRWTKTVSGFNFLCYDFKNNRIV